MPDATDSTRELLLAVAGELLDRQGLDGLSLREIARRAGVSHGAPLRHFPSLANLLAHVSAEAFRGLSAGIDRALAATGPRAAARRRLHAAAHAYARFAVEHPGRYALMFHFDLVDRSEPELAKASHAAFDQLADLVAAAQAEGWNPRADRRHLTGALWGAIHGPVQLWIDQAIQPSTGAARLDDILDPLLGMLVPLKTSRRRERP